MVAVVAVEAVVEEEEERDPLRMEHRCFIPVLERVPWQQGEKERMAALLCTPLPPLLLLQLLRRRMSAWPP